jgi:hypothetical protein
VAISKNAHHIATTAFTTASSNYSADIDGAGNEGWIFGKDELDFALLGRDIQISVSGGAVNTKIWLAFEVIGNGGIWFADPLWGNRLTNSTIFSLTKGGTSPISTAGTNTQAAHTPLALSRVRVHLTGTAATNPQLTVTGIRRGL